MTPTQPPLLPDEGLTERVRTNDDGPSRPARIAIVAFLTFFLFCGLTGFEHWPFTGWHLFSEVRAETKKEFQAYWVDADGEEHELDFLTLPVSYRNSERLMRTFPDDSAAHRERICDAYAAGVRESGQGDPVALRIYRVTEWAPLDEGAAPPHPPERKLRWTCAR